MNIDPELASEWLERVPEDQRNVRDRTVASYAYDMEHGNWRVTFDPFHFSRDGELINGQHRCHAIVKSQVTLKSQAVVFGAERDTYEAMDQGVSRKFADMLKWRGYKNTAVLAAVANRYYVWEATQSFRRPPVPATTTQLMDCVLANHEMMQTGISIGTSVYRQLPLSKSVLAMCYILFSRVAPESEDTNLASDVEYFFARLADGQNVGKGHPIYALRSWILNKRPTAMPEDYVQAAHIIKAWNAYRRGKTIYNLAWRSGGEAPEPFPQPE
jgi:hypothetical protein